MLLWQHRRKQQRRGHTLQDGTMPIPTRNALKVLRRDEGEEGAEHGRDVPKHLRWQGCNSLLKARRQRRRGSPPPCQDPAMQAGRPARLAAPPSGASPVDASTGGAADARAEPAPRATRLGAKSPSARGRGGWAATRALAAADPTQRAEVAALPADRTAKREDRIADGSCYGGTSVRKAD
eukprot:10516654-Alexandrium_andersonii.AAC.1